MYDDQRSTGEKLCVALEVRDYSIFRGHVCPGPNSHIETVKLMSCRRSRRVEGRVGDPHGRPSMTDESQEIYAGRYWLSDGRVSGCSRVGSDWPSNSSPLGPGMVHERILADRALLEPNTKLTTRKTTVSEKNATYISPAFPLPIARTIFVKGVPSFNF